MKSKNRSQDLRRIGLPALLITVVAFAITFQFVKPAPPKEIAIAGGAPGGAYHRWATELAKLFASEGIQATVLETAGSMDNLERLADGRAALGFVQSGLAATRPPDDDRVEGLASLYLEPVWVFSRISPAPDRLNRLRGRRIAVGAPGSGTQVVARALLADNGIDASSATLLELNSNDAAAALLAGTADVAFIVASYRADAVDRLLRAPAVAPMQLARIETYPRRHHYLKVVDLPAGVIDPATDLPSAHVRLLATPALLAVNADLHPALRSLAMQYAHRLFHDGDLLSEPDDYPSAKGMDLPLAPEAKRFFERGVPFLQRYLPFWAATLLDRIAVLLLPLLTLMIPLARFLPPVYRWRVRSRVFRWYEQLEAIDSDADIPGVDPQTLEDRLDRIARDIMGVPVPLSYTDEVYHLRAHIELVRRKVRGDCA
ncbi:MAG: TAXI family TRAP transporter solute-binding subunit [Chromatiales bacterium]|nr:TAXI family TRAP transporter solute-binding subunit [Chromatiales bacterium]